MRLIERTALVIPPDRQRKEFDPEYIADLAKSITKNGLLHAIVTRQKDGQTLLVAGENRIKAIDMLELLGDSYCYEATPVPAGLLPIVDLGELDPIDAEEAELEENIRRKDLTWQERAYATARLHRLRSSQAAERGEVHSVAKTALEVRGRSDGSNQEVVRKDLIVAGHLDNAAVAKAKSAEEAFKILKKEEEARRNAQLAAVVGETHSTDKHSVINADCIQWMQSQPEGQFDVILTDPPYGMGADSFGDAGGKLAGTTHQYDDSLESWRVLVRAWAPLAYRIARPQAHAYVFCDIDNFHELRSVMQDAGWYVFRTPFIVHKINSGRVPLPDRGPRRQWEMALYAIKGNKPVTHIYPDVISVQGDSDISHGAQKPVALFQNLLQRSVRPGDHVLDTFAGTGPIIPAGHSLLCSVTAIELAPQHYGRCLKRLDEINNTDAMEGILDGFAKNN